MSDLTNINLFNARIVWGLYCKYGLGKYDNWLTMKKDKINRDDVVNSLHFDEIKIMAENRIKYHKSKIDEIESMIKECYE